MNSGRTRDQLIIEVETHFNNVRASRPDEGKLALYSIAETYPEIALQADLDSAGAGSGEHEKKHERETPESGDSTRRTLEERTTTHQDDLDRFSRI